MKIFDFIRKHPGSLFLAAVLLATLIVMMILSGGNRALITGEAPSGGQSLQFVTTPLASDRILWSWAVRDLLDIAQAHIKLDFWFIPLYVGSLALVCWRIYRKLPSGKSLGHLKYAAVGVAAAVLAGVLDVRENFGMLQFIDDFRRKLSPEQPLVTLVSSVACAKYVLIGLSLLAIAILDLREVASRPRSSSR